MKSKDILFVSFSIILSAAFAFVFASTLVATNDPVVDKPVVPTENQFKKMGCRPVYHCN